MDLGLDVLVDPMDMGDGELQEPQDTIQTAAVVVPPHALRISSSAAHPEGPMLGFVLSENERENEGFEEHEGAGAADVAADTEEASSDGVVIGGGLERGPNTGTGYLDMEFASLDASTSNHHHSGCFVSSGAGPPDFDPDPGPGAGWMIDWRAAAAAGGSSTSTGVLPFGAEGGEYAGDGTIDPSVLGGAGCGASSPGTGSPGKALRSDATALSDEYSYNYRYPLRSSPMFVRAKDGRDKDAGMRFSEDSTDGSSDFVVQEPGRGKGKGKEKVVEVAVGGGGSGRRVGGDGDKKRIRRKTWRKALADDYNQDHDDENTTEDTDAADDDHRDVGVSAIRHRRTITTTSSTRVEITFCHHCRRKTRRPKMRCTRINKSTGRLCGKLFCDLCIEKRCALLSYYIFFCLRQMLLIRGFLFGAGTPICRSTRSRRRFRVRVVANFVIARFARARVERSTYPSGMEVGASGWLGLQLLPLALAKR